MLTAILAAPIALAQPTRTAARVGLLWLGSPDTVFLRNAFIEELSAQGYVNGRSLVIEDRTTTARYERLESVAAELVGAKPDVIVTYGGTATLAVRKATSTIPIVTVIGGDPVRAGLATSLGHPGGNVTGITSMSVEIDQKRVELLRETLPQIRTVAIMFNPASKVEAAAVANVRHGAGALGLRSYVAEARAPADFETAFAGMAKARADALLVVGSTMFFANRKRIAELALRYRLPTIAVQKDYAEDGFLIAYGPDFAFMFKQAAQSAAKILKGASPSELPFEQSSKIDLLLNLKTARVLGLSIPQPMLLRADRVIE